MSNLFIDAFCSIGDSTTTPPTPINSVIYMARLMERIGSAVVASDDRLVVDSHYEDHGDHKVLAGIYVRPQISDALNPLESTLFGISTDIDAQGYLSLSFIHLAGPYRVDEPLITMPVKTNKGLRDGILEKLLFLVDERLERFSDEADTSLPTEIYRAPPRLSLIHPPAP